MPRCFKLGLLRLIPISCARISKEKDTIMSGVDENGEAGGERSRKGLKNLDYKNQIQENFVVMEGFGSYSSWTRGACQEGSDKI